MSDPDGGFFETDKALLILNRALASISSKSRSITESFFRPVTVGQFNYALPESTIEIKKAKYKSGNWIDLVRHNFSEVERVGSNNTGTPQWFAQGENARWERVIEVIETRDLGGSNAFAVGLENNVMVGDVIYNLSDFDAHAVVITTNDAQGQRNIVHGGLTGGRRNDIEEGDSIRIVSQNAPFKALTIAPAAPKTDAVGEESLAVFLTRRHRQISMQDINNGSDGLELDRELDDTLLYETLHWGSLMYDGLKSDAANYKTLANTEFNKVIHIVRDRVSENINTWQTGLVRTRPDVILNSGGITNLNDYNVG